MNKEKEAIMKDKIKNILDITFWKFVLVGIVNTLVGTAVMFAAYNGYPRHPIMLWGVL